ncbi:MAG: dTDP-glucose 4,6-dehydratase [Fimbriimonadia bacterium]|jgi:dTDP-glucose 4,6-dehydratase
MQLLITGGAGFIGSHLVHHMLREHSDYRVRVLDALTYAGSRDNLKEVEGDQRFEFVHGDILDIAQHPDVLRGVDAVLHLAAETHNDRAILECGGFVLTDVLGTQRMLQASLEAGVKRFLHVSTCEVYGAIETGRFREDDPFHPNQPYSASKAGGDLIARTYHRTYGMDVVIARPVNNLGPRQFPEKLIPLMISRAMHDQPLPVYGDGRQVREWIHVDDCCRALDTILHRGVAGEAYNVGANIERENLDVIRTILRLLGKPETLVAHVADRPGHDRRYALDVTKIHTLGWRAEIGFDDALGQTVQWYVAHRDWVDGILARSEEHRAFLRKWYESRLDGDLGNSQYV